MLITTGSVLKDEKGNSFTLDEMISSGGFGSVYQARRDNDDQIFAVKTLSSDFESEDKLRSFKNEIRLTENISSPNVIKYEYAHDGTTFPEFPPYIIMEFASQGTLTEIICEQKKMGEYFDNAALVQMFSQLASGMKIINDVLVHRDIKPDNILVCDDTLKISDFGLSKIAGEDTRSLTFKGYGTLKYIAPEAWNNDRNTIQMDIYSMGIVFYELATLQYPYEIKESIDHLGFRDVHLYQAPRDPMKDNPELSPHLASLILKMTEKSTQKRYTNWDDIISALSLEIAPTDFISSIVEKATKRRTEADLEHQNLVLEEKKHQQDIEDFCKLIYFQYETTILTPILEFVEKFNLSYQGNQKIAFTIPSPYHVSYKFLNTMKMSSGNVINFEFDAVLLENCYRENYENRFSRQHGYRNVSNIPNCRGREILGWGQISAGDQKGFNLLLLKTENDMYGEWWTMTNTNSGLGPRKRIEPFGFKLIELPKEIQLITAMHIYSSELKKLDMEYVFQFITEYV